MITSTRIGRYGNTCNAMFQLAALIGMSKKTGLDYCVPYHETYYEPNYGCTNNSIWDGFDLSYDERRVKYPDNCVIKSCNYLDNCMITPTEPDTKFKEVEFPFEYKDILVDDFTDMVGFFQSEKYFEGAEQEIKDQFKIKEVHKQVVDAKIKSGEYPDPLHSTSLHLRLGDYTIKRNYHPEIPVRYWAQAMASIPRRDNVVIFSDDVEQARSMFGNDSRLTYSTEENPFPALYHMSLCRNHIICNSTFGWWGAKLGEWNNPVDKVVVAPKIWFGPAHEFSSEDIIPNRWIKL